MLQARGLTAFVRMSSGRSDLVWLGMPWFASIFISWSCGRINRRSVILHKSRVCILVIVWLSERSGSFLQDGILWDDVCFCRARNPLCFVEVRSLIYMVSAVTSSVSWCRQSQAVFRGEVSAWSSGWFGANNFFALQTTCAWRVIAFRVSIRIRLLLFS